jgi:hypothetical protein
VGATEGAGDGVSRLETFSAKLFEAAGVDETPAPALTHHFNGTLLGAERRGQLCRIVRFGSMRCVIAFADEKRFTVPRSTLRRLASARKGKNGTALGSDGSAQSVAQATVRSRISKTERGQR